MKWYHDAADDGQQNMSKDLLLLEEAEKGIARGRIYTWKGPWVSLGKFQDPNEDLLSNCEVPWVMRPTGGRAVLHGHDITLAVGMPFSLLISSDEDFARLSRSVKRVYRKLIDPIIRAMRMCGCTVVLAESTKWVSQKGRSADCFAHISPNDLVDENTGLKICGCALRLTENAVLLQASIPTSDPLVNPSRIFLKPAHYGKVIIDVEIFLKVIQEKFKDYLENIKVH